MKRLLLLLAIFVAADAYACSCAYQSRKQLFNRASTVFVGELVSYDNEVATFRVLQPFKGVPTRTLKVRTALWSASCGYGEALAPKSRHLIYAYPFANELRTNLCSGSTPAASARLEIMLLQTQTWYLRAQRGNPPG